MCNSLNFQLVLVVKVCIRYAIAISTIYSESPLFHTHWDKKCPDKSVLISKLQFESLCMSGNSILNTEMSSFQGF